MNQFAPIYPRTGRGRRSLFDGEYDVERMNQEFSLVIVGKDPVILWTRPDAGEDEEVRFITIAAFKTISAHAWTSVKAAGRLKCVTFAERWLGDRNRSFFAGIEFFPSADSQSGRPEYYNLWRGFSVAPTSQGSCDVFKDHLLTNVCHGD